VTVAAIVAVAVAAAMAPRRRLRLDFGLFGGIRRRSDGRAGRRFGLALRFRRAGVVIAVGMTVTVACAPADVMTVTVIVAFV
jgi:hypothetical protein